MRDIANGAGALDVVGVGIFSRLMFPHLPVYWVVIGVGTSVR